MKLISRSFNLKPAKWISLSLLYLLVLSILPSIIMADDDIKLYLPLLIQSPSTITPTSTPTATPTSTTISQLIATDDDEVMLYLPLLQRAPPIPTSTPTATPTITPTPTPTEPPILYSHDFDDKEWSTNSGNGCDYSYKSENYRIKAKANTMCIRTAPKSAHHQHATFEVEAWHDDGTDQVLFGLFTNLGYAFALMPDSCKDKGRWHLFRLNSKGGFNQKKQGCHSAIKPHGRNLLRVEHFEDGVLKLYINEEYVGQYKDSQPFTDKKTGVFVRTLYKNSTVRFDDFKVYRVP